MKPVVKWPGGKTQCLKYIKELMPATYNIYFEPFFGGGAVLFSLEEDKKAIINDINPELINLYRQIKSNPEKIIDALENIDYIHNTSDDPKKYYYTVREYFNSQLGSTSIEQAARFIYLNKHCFNGLYRVNSKGEFNVPFNGKTSGSSFDSDNIYEVSKRLQNVDLLIGDFEAAVSNAASGDLIYFDPPYDYETNDGFVDYSKAGWTREDSIKLKHLCDRLVDCGCYVLVSNNSTTFINELFNDTRYSIEEITARRAINRKGNGRGPVPEVIIRSKNCI